MKYKKALRIVHVVSDMHRGGAETMIMNLYRNIDRNKLQFDFICHYRKDDHNGLNKKADYYDEITKLGGRIFKIPSLGTSSPIEYIKNIKNILNENGPFEAVHVHTNKQAGFSLIGAKLAKVKKRIIHSHTANWNQLNKHYMQILKILIKLTANCYCACGEEAAINAFGLNSTCNKKVILLNNSIDVEQYSNVEREKINQLKDNLKINNETIVIGHIGRFSVGKNHNFIIDLADKFKKDNKDFIVLLIGTGPLVDEVRDKISKLKLESNIKLLGVREDIDILMNLFDVFILPSLFEGLPLVGVEAQAAGTKCIISDTVTSEIDMGLDLMKQLPITSDYLEDWENEIFNANKVKVKKERILEALTSRGYNVKTNVKKLYKLYGLEH